MIGWICRFCVSCIPVSRPQVPASAPLRPAKLWRCSRKYHKRRIPAVDCPSKPLVALSLVQSLPYLEVPAAMHTVLITQSTAYPSSTLPPSTASHSSCSSPAYILTVVGSTAVFVPTRTGIPAWQFRAPHKRSVGPCIAGSSDIIMQLLAGIIPQPVRLYSL